MLQSGNTPRMPLEPQEHGGYQAYKLPPTPQEYSAGKVVLVITLFCVSLVAFVLQTETTAAVYREGFNEPFLLLYITHGLWWVMWPTQVGVVSMWKTYKRYQKSSAGYHNLLEENGEHAKMFRGFQKTFASCVKAQHRKIYDIADLIAQNSIPDYVSPTYPHRTHRSHSPRTYREFLLSPALKFIFKRCFLIMIFLTVAGSSWYVAMSLSTGSDVTAIYNCSAFAAYAFAIPLLGEKFSWLKMGSVVIAVGGVFIVAYSGSSSDEDEHPHRLLGNLLILAGAVMYGFYECIYKKWVCPPANLVSAKRQATFANFTGSVIGVFSFLAIGVVLLFVQLLGLHEFSVPNKLSVHVLMVASIVCNIVFSGSFLSLMALTSPVLSSVASLVTILFVGLADWLILKVNMTVGQVVGNMVVVVGFSVLTYASWAEISEEEKDDVSYSDVESTASSQVN